MNVLGLDGITMMLQDRGRPHAGVTGPVHVLPREILSAYELLTEVEQGLARLTSLPALIVWGDRDQALREPQRLAWERTFPNHRTVILTGASHYIEEDAPDEIVAAIRDWWPGTSNT